MAETCPACGAQASGRFCNQCGAALDAACAGCGKPLPAGARFCNQCGATAASAAPAAPRLPAALPWAMAGVAIAALLLVLLLRERSDPAPAAQPPFAPAPGAAAPAGDPASVDLASMTPREAADRLFNRVMTAVAAGDTAQAHRFQPMAVGAYARARPLDTDGRYHLAALHLVGGEYVSARAQADSILAASPTHLFGLFAAAQAADGSGDRQAAVGLYRRLLAAFDAEVARGLPEYREHSQGLPAMREQARLAAGSP